MLDELTPGQFAEWWGYYLLEPFGDEWRQSTLGAFATLRAHGGTRARRLSPDDLLPVPKRTRYMDAAQAEAVFKTFARAHNAAIGA